MLKLLLGLLTALLYHGELAIDLVDSVLVLPLGDVHLHLPRLGALFLPVVTSHDLLDLSAQLRDSISQLLILLLLLVESLAHLCELPHLGLELGVLPFELQGGLQVGDLVLQDLPVVLQVREVHLLALQLLLQAADHLVLLVQ